MRVVVVYESMFGNTEVIARAIAEGIGAGSVELVNVDDAPTELGAHVDLLVAGGPTHVHGMSRPSTRKSAKEQAETPVRSGKRGIREWLGSFGVARQGVLAATFDTRVGKPRWLTGSAATSAMKVLRRKGFTVARAPESFVVSDSGPCAVPADGEVERARNWGSELAAKVLSGSR